MKRLLLFCGVWTLAGPIGAADAGTSGAAFLKLGPGPRAAALGDAYTALADETSAAYWNPAGLVRLSRPEAAFSHTSLPEDIRHQFAAVAFPVKSRRAWAASLTHLKVGAFPGADAAGTSIGDVSAQDVAAGLSYAHALWKDPRFESECAWGATLKWIQEKLHTVSAQAFAADLGCSYAPGRRRHPLWGGWRFGAAWRNLGEKLTFDQDAFSLPRIFAAGLSYTGAFGPEKITLSFDGRLPREGPPSSGVGLEWWSFDTLALRAGYSSEANLSSAWRFGIGVRLTHFTLDYAFAGAGEFGATHRVGVTVRLAGPREDPRAEAQRWFEKGEREFRENRLTEALIAFDRALAQDPSHPFALERMTAVSERLRGAAHER